MLAYFIFRKKDLKILCQYELSDLHSGFVATKVFLFQKTASQLLVKYLVFVFFQQLIPLFVVVGVGCVGAAGYVLRLALQNPDCTCVSFFPCFLTNCKVFGLNSSMMYLVHCVRGHVTKIESPSELIYDLYLATSRM